MASYVEQWYEHQLATYYTAKPQVTVWKTGFAMKTTAPIWLYNQQLTSNNKTVKQSLLHCYTCYTCYGCWKLILTTRGSIILNLEMQLISYISRGELTEFTYLDYSNSWRKGVYNGFL